MSPNVVLGSFLGVGVEGLRVCVWGLGFRDFSFDFWEWLGDHTGKPAAQIMVIVSGNNSTPGILGNRDCHFK